MSSTQRNVFYSTDHHNEVTNDQRDKQLANNSHSSSMHAFKRWVKCVKDAIRKVLRSRARPAPSAPSYLDTRPAGHGSVSNDVPPSFLVYGPIPESSPPIRPAFVSPSSIQVIQTGTSHVTSRSLSYQSDEPEFSPGLEQVPLSYGRVETQIKGSQPSGSVVKTATSGGLPKLG